MKGISEHDALTEQEARVAGAVGTGMSNKAVTRELNVSIKTVEFHLSNVYRKLRIASRFELANHINRGAGASGTVAPSGNLAPQRASLLGRATGQTG